MISVKAEVDQVARYLTRTERRQLPFAVALSLTRAAQHVKSRTLVRVLPQIFDRPTRWVLPNRNPKSKQGGFFVIPATKQRPTAVVQIKDGVTRGAGAGAAGTPAFNILQPQIESGPRRVKGFERKLQGLGILARDEYTTPARGVRKNTFGNLSKKTYDRIFADLEGSNAGFRGSRYNYYFFHPNLKPRGIWFRAGRRALRLVLVFVKAPRYRKRFDFQGISRRSAAKRWPREFQTALARALASAR